MNKLAEDNQNQENPKDNTQEQVVVSDDDINRVEQELKQQRSNTEKEIADKVRKEMEMERKVKELEAERAKREEEYKQQQEELARLKKEQEEALNKEVERRLAEEQVRRKAVVVDKTPKQTTGLGDLSPDDIKRIEEESASAFINKHRLPL